MLGVKCAGCEKSVQVYPYQVRAGLRKYCGTACRSRTKWNTRHGMSRSPIYQKWCGMKGRCQNPNNPFYPYYGGRGISVCDEWLEFAPFHEWAKKSGYRDGLEIDRRDAEGDYSPENCRWASRHQQMSNTRKRKMAGVTSKYKGVSWCPKIKRWRAYVTVSGVTSYLGISKVEEEAAELYDVAARKAFGDFAHTNFKE